MSDKKVCTTCNYATVSPDSEPCKMCVSDGGRGLDPTQWKPINPTDGAEIRAEVPSPLEDVVDLTERQLWCSVYVERMRRGALPEDAPTSWDLADQAVAEYRKRYGAERVG